MGELLFGAIVGALVGLHVAELIRVASLRRQLRRWPWRPHGASHAEIDLGMSKSIEGRDGGGWSPAKRHPLINLRGKR